MPIEGFEHYQVSNLGNVQSFKASKQGKRLKQKRTNTGYLEVTLYSGNKPQKYLVHRLVLNAFRFVPLKGKHKIKHIDGNPSNNQLSNLSFGDSTQSSVDNALADAILNAVYDGDTYQFICDEDEVEFI